MKHLRRLPRMMALTIARDLSALGDAVARLGIEGLALGLLVDGGAEPHPGRPVTGRDDAPV
jgi:hypothetical protein